MAYSLNRIQLKGRLGKDPGIRKSSNGFHFATLNVCTSQRFKKNDEWQEVSQWHEVTVFDAKAVTYVEKEARKGSLVYVEGAMEYGTFTGNDGVERKSARVVVRGSYHCVEVLVAPPKRDQASPSNSGSTLLPPAADDLDDEIPF